MVEENIGMEIPKGPRIICVDFDGVIHSYTSGWQGVSKIFDPPVPGAFDWLRRMISDDRFKICIYSSRSREPDGIIAMKMWFFRHGMEEQYIYAMGFPDRKPSAYLTIDDRCICFDGRFPTDDEILSFQPWYRKGLVS